MNGPSSEHSEVIFVEKMIQFCLLFPCAGTAVLSRSLSENVCVVENEGMFVIKWREDTSC